jgi:hypothetical protein
MNGKEIEQVHEMKYLGVMLNDRMTNTTHLDSKRKAAIRSSYLMSKCGIESMKMNPRVKAFLYKTYCRPIMLYGIENFRLLKSEEKKIQTAEAMIVKRHMILSKRSRTSALIGALNIEHSEDKIQVAKCSFFLRLMQNTLTRKIIEKICSLYRSRPSYSKTDKSIIGEIAKKAIEKPTPMDFVPTLLARKAQSLIQQVQKKVTEKQLSEESKKVGKILDSLTNVTALNELKSMLAVNFYK